MAFVDDVRDYAKKAGDAVKKGADAARVKSRELSLKRRQKAIQTDLGHVVFRQREGETGLDAEIERLTSELRGVRAEIEGLHDD